MADTFEFEDALHVERLTGTLHDPAATVGHVLTVQADKSIAAAAGGGSQSVELVTVNYAFDGGVATVVTMNPGDQMLMAFAKEITPWNGDTPVIYLEANPDWLGTDFAFFDVETGDCLISGLSLSGPNGTTTAFDVQTKLGTFADPDVPPGSTAGESALTFGVLRLGIT